MAWGVLALGLWPITPAPPALLLGWWLGQSADLGLAGAVLGAGRRGMPLGRLWKRAGTAVVALVALTMVLQSVGWAPSVRAG